MRRLRLSKNARGFSFPARFLLPILLALSACATPAPTASPLPSATVAPTLTPLPGSTALATVLPSPTASAAPSPTITVDSEACKAEICQLNGHFLFSRPVPVTATRFVERSYPYASTQNDTREAHHGVEFYNPQGTPVLAAADGVTVFAGDDALTLLSWVTGFYGNVVVLQHSWGAETFYTLYGHLHEVQVAPGEAVSAGQTIGTVGASGTAIGSHLHFEVRRGQNDYFSTRNPELWLAPLPGYGALAGRIEDGQGNLLRGTVNLQKVENGAFLPASVGQAQTYARERVNADDVLQENFALGDLPAGEYRLSLVMGGAVHEKWITIMQGSLTFVIFIVP